MNNFSKFFNKKYVNLIEDNYLIWLFYNKYLIYSNVTTCVYVFIFTWLFEWIYLIQYSFNFWSYTRIFFPYRIPCFLIFCFIYWIYVWGVSIWRRTLFGRFVRGDRKLWFKGFVSFWFVEISTILGIYIAACWMSWGPLPLMPRYFLMQKKSFLFELTIFTYIVWLIYLMRFSLKWNLWKTQALISSIIIFIISCLVWRDFVTLYTRDVININFGSKWRYVQLHSIIYSLSSVWWTKHFMGDNITPHSMFISLQNVLDSNCKILPFTNLINLTEYQKYHWMPFIFSVHMFTEMCPFISLDSLQYNNSYRLIDVSQTTITKRWFFYNLDSNIFYPRRIGFYTKKMAMWYFLVVLKIWHHLMLFIWWFFYLLRLISLKKSSYSLLSACYFNVYCCFLICILIYCYNQLPVWENYFRIKPIIRANLQNWCKLTEGFYYCLDLITLSKSTKGSKWLLSSSFYKITPNSIINFNKIF